MLGGRVSRVCRAKALARARENPYLDVTDLGGYDAAG